MAEGTTVATHDGRARAARLPRRTCAAWDPAVWTDQNDSAVQRTTIAQQAIEFGAAFSGYLKIHAIEGEITRVAQLRAPDGVSTSGGKHARQPLILEPLPGENTTVTTTRNTLRPSFTVGRSKARRW